MKREWLEECVRRFGPPPRRFSFWDRWLKLAITKPSWMRQAPDDELRILFDNVPAVWRDGVVVWGTIIQANALLFQAGKDDCPGELAYTLHDDGTLDPFDLADVARSLFQLKGTTPVQWDQHSIAAYLTDERVRVFGLPVPHSLSPKFPCRISTTFFVREHLPGKRLQCPLLPIVVLPTAPHAALPLPERYWPTAMLQWWIE